MPAKINLKLTHDEMVLLIKILQRVDPKFTLIGDAAAQNHVRGILEYDASHVIDPEETRNFQIMVNQDIFEKIIIVIDTQSADGRYWGLSKHVWWRLYSAIWSASKLVETKRIKDN